MEPIKAPYLVSGIVLLIALSAVASYFLVAKTAEAPTIPSAQSRQQPQELPPPEEPSIEELLVVSHPQIWESISSPASISGQARGQWFFEASFPVRLFDSNGTLVATTIATARPSPGKDWMTPDFVPFTATLEFPRVSSETGMLVFENDNPSGLPEFKREYRLPISFRPVTPPQKKETVQTCRATGCSGQICAEENVITTCEFSSEYVCYRSARCERQANGACGWTQTSALRMCLAKTRTESPSFTY
ncbi:MAG: Gmad2 immunoglobulin-like domain-containing protein [Patescibacteria group bacterium]